MDFPPRTPVPLSSRCEQFRSDSLIQTGYGNPTIRRKLGGNMLTSAECRANAEQKLTEAEPDCDKRQQMRLIEAAQAWLILASQIRRIEASYAAAPQSYRAAALSPLSQIPVGPWASLRDFKLLKGSKDAFRHDERCQPPKVERLRKSERTGAR